MIGEVVGVRPGTLLPWKPNRSPLLCGVKLPAVIQAVMLRSAKLSHITLHTFKMNENKHINLPHLDFFQLFRMCLIFVKYKIPNIILI